ncbi:hypothetical protein SORBI_3007G179500 [Sorghum bicolor]|uniref:Uncharacterized protein n=1 Tax=Sorghum bicolor TaxID=4558 RepID=A0A1B6PID2_SORBI|nr:hypothetical protein SORBI_3007G179500 [Sorghum bicolor]
MNRIFIVICVICSSLLGIERRAIKADKGMYLSHTNTIHTYIKLAALTFDKFNCCVWSI